MLATIALILLVVWVAGLSLHLLGGFIYLFLVAALIVGAAHFFTRKHGNNLV